MSDEMIFVGIAGASGSGKSSLARSIAGQLEEEFGKEQVVVLQEDAYYRSRDDLTFQQREQINYDHPDAIEHSLLLEHLQRLRQGVSVAVPQYDYTSHNRQANFRWLHPPRLLLLEGILVLHDVRIRSELNLSVYVDVPLDVCLTRRLTRDVNSRGRTATSVKQQFQDTVKPMYFEFIEPTRKLADIIVPGGGENEKAVALLIAFLERQLADGSDG